ncbi:hypothetical protein GZH47_26680 [Paenibacillus rhizovicinus]|uniref:J domain-containing protein n=1 Tax=Paenibacillus rhizovicinus TaxID=2704463 RepID=A0A6C0P6G8_9BACL|nr:hypothetical protein [Paenibacillus rhizovicinus]QHW34025.1 hypothetical protein GZH47_26680 [Paenibacillus rhizovicinus]
MDDELKKAYEVLGLAEGASRKEVENRYYILTRRERASRQRKESGHTDEEPFSLEEITPAYNTLLEYYGQHWLKRFSSAVYRKLNRNNKLPVISAIFSVIVIICILIFGTKNYFDRRHDMAELAKLPPVDLSVAIFGEYTSREGTYTNIEFKVQAIENNILTLKVPSVSDMKPLEADIRSSFPQWTNVKANFLYMPAKIKTGLEELYLENTLGVMLKSKSDVYIMDKASFIRMAGYYALIPLEGADAAKLGPGLKPELKLKAKTEDGLEEHVYGVDISGSPLLKQLPVVGNEFIAGIGSTSEQPDHAFEFIENYLK